MTASFTEKENLADVALTKLSKEIRPGSTVVNGTTINTYYILDVV